MLLIILCLLVLVWGLIMGGIIGWIGKRPMKTMKIEKSAPDWVRRSRVERRGRPDRRYPFDDLQVGCSFVIPPDEQACQFRSFQVHVSAVGRKMGKRFLVRLMPDGSFECWRDL